MACWVIIYNSRGNFNDGRAEAVLTLLLGSDVKAQINSQRGMNGRFLEIHQTLMNLMKIKVMKYKRERD